MKQLGTVGFIEYYSHRSKLCICWRQEFLAGNNTSLQTRLQQQDGVCVKYTQQYSEFLANSGGLWHKGMR